MDTKKFLLQENDIPRAWYNIVADMKNKPMPPLHPGTKKPLQPEDLYPIFAKELVHQELNTTDAWIEIPDEIRDMYKVWRPTPLVRAYGLEKALDTPAHIYFKNESTSMAGSHKPNTAIPQAVVTAPVKKDSILFHLNRKPRPLSSRAHQQLHLRLFYPFPLRHQKHFEWYAYLFQLQLAFLQ